MLYTRLYKEVYTRELKLYMILYVKLYISLYIKRKKGTPQIAYRIALVKKKTRKWHTQKLKLAQNSKNGFLFWHFR